MKLNNISRNHGQRQWDEEDEESKEFGDKSKNVVNTSVR